MSNRSSRHRLAAGLGAVLLSTSMLAACGADEPAPLSANAQWADGICGAYSELETALGALGDDIPESTGTISERLAAAGDVIQSRIDAVRSASAALTAAAQDVPADADASLETSRAEVNTAIDDAGVALSDAETALRAAAETPSLESLSALGTAASTLATKVGDAAQLGKEALQEAEGEARTAFKEAPACQPYLTS